MFFERKIDKARQKIKLMHAFTVQCTGAGKTNSDVALYCFKGCNILSNVDFFGHLLHPLR
jgi:hypothetical protein